MDDNDNNEESEKGEIQARDVETPRKYFACPKVFVTAVCRKWSFDNACTCPEVSGGGVGGGGGGG